MANPPAAPAAAAEDDSSFDSSTPSSPTSSSPSSSSSSSEDEQETQHLRRHSRPSSPPPPPPNPDFPFSPHQPPPLSALPLILSRNLSFTSDFGPFRIALASFSLGCLITFGLLLSLVQPLSLPFPFGLFLSFWALFHWLEFCLTALFHPGNLSFTSFLLNHSRAFHIAFLSSITEYFLELFLFPSLKRSLLFPALALPLLLLSQSCRSLSMWQASTNFTHLVSHTKHPQHHLITTGLYSLSRHPSYSAWYLWSLSTQLLLSNPLCMAGYAYVGWRFFAARIEYEEMKLVEFFGEEYEQYQQRVWSGIPGLMTRGERDAGGVRR